ncbi:winged helix-turn-helix domain-containing tetratricopeptide repeat protein [Altererythrobacter sp. Root672]|uniref:winged helix-turn-helix domain-containing tetratricopeptide repeat protein n=1 Tax=Altererythrobacter sp. Root672 TaxID=1736584 RepID=UPI001F2E3A48|nr:winged helix-turn-helix domain-containing protein [Altererythrobacter sp. Root672]
MSRDLERGAHLDEIRLGSRTLQPRRQLLVGGRREPLGKRALDIVSVLAEARGRIVTKDELLEAVWPGVVVEENALHVHVVALRKALGPEADRLRTIRGVGYQLDIDGTGNTYPAEMERDETEGRAQGRYGTDASAQTELSPAVASAGSIKTKSQLALSVANRRSWRVPIALAALMIVLVGAWSLFDPAMHLGAGERIPVAVRELAPSGGEDSTEVALASGITDELIVRLRRVPALRIATAGPDGTVPGNEFRNAYVVDGTIRTSGERVRVAARLLSPGGEVVWSQTFNRNLVDLFEVQELIAASVADALSVSLDVGTNSTTYGGTNNPEAFAAYLQSRAHMFDADQSVPVDYAEQALAFDPHYGKAYSQLATVLGIQVNTANKTQAGALLAKIDDLTARAIAANPQLPSGHLAREYYYLQVRDYSSAERSFRRAAELDDGKDPELRGNLAFSALFLGRSNKALSLYKSTEMIDPITERDPVRAWPLASLGRCDEALELIQRLTASNASIAQGITQIVFWCRLALGQEAEALRFAEEHDPRWATAFRSFMAERELPTLSAAQLRRWAASRYGESGHAQLVNDALFASHAGHPQLAINLLRIAFERPGGYGALAMWSPLMARARRSPEFARLVTDIGLVKVWRESGDWGDFCRPVSATEIACN